MAKVIVYSTPTCSFCQMTKEFLAEHEIDFVEKDITADEAARDESVEKSGQSGVPVIDVDGEIVVGYNQEKLRELLKIK